MSTKTDRNIKQLSFVFIGLALAIYFGKKPVKKMYTDLKNEMHLSELHPKYQKLFRVFIQSIKNLGYIVQINSGYRDFKKQAELKKQDSRNAASGFSMHNYGLALDLQIKKPNGKWLGKNTNKSEWLATGVPQIADRLGLFWGANFKGYSDAVHFEIKNINTAKLYSAAVKQFNTTNPDLIKGNEVKLV